MKQPSSKSKKIIIAVTVCAVVLALVIAIPNIYLTQKSYRVHLLQSACGAKTRQQVGC